MRKFSLFVLCCAVVLLLVSPLSAGAIRTDASFYANALGPNDDGSTNAVSLGFADPLNFFGLGGINHVFVNNNGNMTFDQQYWTYTPFNLLSTNAQMIAPFFGDVDTRSYPANNSALVHYGNGTVDGHQAFAADWAGLNGSGGVNGVGFYSEQTNHLNSFQAVLIDRSDTGAGNFDIEFNYDQIQWEAGQASGGSWQGLGGDSARAGWTNGSTHAFELTGSGVNGAFLDGGPSSLVAGSLDSGVTGRYVWEVRNNGAPTQGQSQTDPLIPTTFQNGVWYFPPNTSGDWYDPLMSYGYQYDDVTPGSLFTGVTLPSLFNNLTISYGCATLGPGCSTVAENANAHFDFSTPVSRFWITGLNPLQDPNNTSAFPVQLFFNPSPAAIEIRPLNEDVPGGPAVPEPATMTLFGLGSLGLAAWRRRRS